MILWQIFCIDFHGSSERTGRWADRPGNPIRSKRGRIDEKSNGDSAGRCAAGGQVSVDTSSQGAESQPISQFRDLCRSRVMLPSIFAGIVIAGLAISILTFGVASLF